MQTFSIIIPAKNIINYKNSTISWRQWGSGPVHVICLHGYGENAEAFSFLAKDGETDYTYFAIDAPFHGDTIWNEGLLFTPEDILQIINKITESISAKFILMGYSMGGRMALSLYELIPERIEKMLLIAPDGLKINFWYWFSTQTLIGKTLFYFTLKKPQWFFGFLKLLDKLKLVNPSIFKFVHTYIDDKKVRQELYNRWIGFRKIKPNLKKIQSQINTYRTPVRIIYGKHDKIILHSVGERFKNGIEHNFEIIILDAGHQLLREKYKENILQQLKT